MVEVMVNYKEHTILVEELDSIVSRINIDIDEDRDEGSACEGRQCVN